MASTGLVLRRERLGKGEGFTGRARHPRVGRRERVAGGPDPHGPRRSRRETALGLGALGRRPHSRPTPPALFPFHGGRSFRAAGSFGEVPSRAPPRRQPGAGRLASLAAPALSGPRAPSLRRGRPPPTPAALPDPAAVLPARDDATSGRVVHWRPPRPCPCPRPPRRSSAGRLRSLQTALYRLRRPRASSRPAAAGLGLLDIVGISGGGAPLQRRYRAT